MINISTVWRNLWVLLEILYLGRLYMKFCMLRKYTDFRTGVLWNTKNAYYKKFIVLFDRLRNSKIIPQFYFVAIFLYVKLHNNGTHCISKQNLNESIVINGGRVIVCPTKMFPTCLGKNSDSETRSMGLEGYLCSSCTLTFWEVNGEVKLKLRNHKLTEILFNIHRDVY